MKRFTRPSIKKEKEETKEDLKVKFKKVENWIDFFYGEIIKDPKPTIWNHIDLIEYKQAKDDLKYHSNDFVKTQNKKTIFNQYLKNAREREYVTYNNYDKTINWLRSIHQANQLGKPTRTYINIM